MKYKQAIVAMTALTLSFLGGISGVKVGSARISSVNDGDINREEMILESIETEDYDSWRKLVNFNSNLAKKVGREDFHKFVLARNLARRGEYDKAIDIYNDLKWKVGISSHDIKAVADALDIAT